MTLPPVMRAFFAIELPIAVKQEINRWVNTLKPKAPVDAIRWVQPEHLHITLQFLPALRSVDLPILVEQACQALQASPPLECYADKLMLLPNPHHPHVIALAIMPQEALALIAQALGDVMVACHYPLEKRLFRAHLTVARIHQSRVDLDFLQQAPVPAAAALTVKEVVLFRSEPGEHGSCYTRLATIPLAKTGKAHD